MIFLRKEPLYNFDDDLFSKNHLSDAAAQQQALLHAVMMQHQQQQQQQNQQVKIRKK